MKREGLRVKRFRWSCFCLESARSEIERSVIVTVVSSEESVISVFIEREEVRGTYLF